MSTDTGVYTPRRIEAVAESQPSLSVNVAGTVGPPEAGLNHYLIHPRLLNAGAIYLLSL